MILEKRKKKIKGVRERADDKTKGKKDETLCCFAACKFFFRAKWLWRILKMAERNLFSSRCHQNFHDNLCLLSVQ